MQNKRFKKKRSPLKFIIAIIIILIAIITFLKLNKNGKNITIKDTSNYDNNSLIGTFLYEENNTIYEFKEDGTGKMSSGNYNYEYKYKVDGNILEIDFSKDEVHDAKYSFELKDIVYLSFGKLKFVINFFSFNKSMYFCGNINSFLLNP